MVWRIHFSEDDLARIQVSPTMGPLAETVLAVALLRSPQQPRTMLEAAQAAYHELVQPFWPRIRACLHAEQATRRRTLTRQGPGALLGSLQGPRIRWRPPILEILMPSNVEMELGGRGIALVPSVFVGKDPSLAGRPGREARACRRSRPPERRERTIVSSGGMRRGRRGAGPATAAAVLALLASGCSSSSTGSGGSAGNAANPGTSSTVTIDLTAQGCAPKPARIPAGSVDFNVTNSGAGSVSEAELRTADLGKILGEKENLTPGLSGSFSLTLQPGIYKVSCPGASQPHWTFTVTGKATGPSWQSDPRLAAAVRAE